MNISVIICISLFAFQEFNEKIGENLGENLSMPITYYSAVSTSSPQLISFVNSAVLDSSSGDKISVADKDRESEMHVFSCLLLHYCWAQSSVYYRYIG